jgi:hypothetical protein
MKKALTDYYFRYIAVLSVLQYNSMEVWLMNPVTEEKASD